MVDLLPSELKAYKRTPIFDQETLPAGLRRKHSTKVGVWALIHVLEGRLRYRIIDPPSETILTPDAPGIVRPQQLHEVEPIEKVQFYVEFYSTEPDGGSPHQGNTIIR